MSRALIGRAALLAKLIGPILIDGPIAILIGVVVTDLSAVLREAPDLGLNTGDRGHGVAFQT